jgi:hypothetical protein
LGQMNRARNRVRERVWSDRKRDAKGGKRRAAGARSKAGSAGRKEGSGRRGKNPNSLRRGNIGSPKIRVRLYFFFTFSLPKSCFRVVKVWRKAGRGKRIAQGAKREIRGNCGREDEVLDKVRDKVSRR